MKLYSSLILLCFVTSYATAQFPGDTVRADFNNDGSEDRLIWYYDGGSGFGGRFATVINGKTKEELTFDTYSCFCQIMHLIFMPEQLGKKENSSFREIIEKEVLPDKRYAPDPSLQWILDGLFSNKEVNNSYYEYVIDPGSGWNEGEFIFPSTYFIDAKDHLIHKLVTYYSDVADEYKASGNKGYLIYYGHNHFRIPSGDSLKLCDRNSIYKVYRTSHGVFVKKKDRYKWVFVTETALTGSPEKYRWESIKKVKLVGNYIIIQQSKPMHEKYDIYVVNIESGICGRVQTKKHMYDEYPELNSLTFTEESLRINAKDKLIEISISALFSELEKLYIQK